MPPEEAGAAPAAAEPIAQPQDAGGSGAEPQAQPVERSKEPARASVDRAFAAIDKAETAQPEVKTETAAEKRARDEATGRFTAKNPQPVVEQTPEQQAADKALVDQAAADKTKTAAIEPPSRFSVDAKAAWATVPDSVKGEVNRAVRELEGGLREYQQTFEPLKPFFALAKQHETTVHEAMARYTSLDQSLAGQDPKAKFSAIQELIEYAGLSPRDYAALVMGQKPDEVQSRNDAEVRELRSENMQLKQQLGGVTASMQERQEKEVKTQVEAFAKEHTRLNDEKFAGKVAHLLKIGIAENLQDAYDMVDGLIPAPAADTPLTASTAAPPKPAPDQTRKGQLSISGAPASGSNPVARKAPVSPRDALDRSFASLGIT